MRIAVFTSEFPSVSQTFVVNQIAGLTETGHDVSIWANRRGGEALLPEDTRTQDLLARTTWFNMPQNRILRGIESIWVFGRLALAQERHSARSFCCLALCAAFGVERKQLLSQRPGCVPHEIDQGHNGASLAAIRFKGFTIQMSRRASTGKPYPKVRPAEKSQKKIKARLTELTGRELTAIPLGDIVGRVNHTLRGWANYFHYRN